MSIAAQDARGLSPDAETQVEFSSSAVSALEPGSLLGSFNRVGILAPADVHVALCLSRLAAGADPDADADEDEVVALGVAFAVRAPRVGHVYADLRTLRRTAGAGLEDQGALDALPWPDAEEWIDRMRASPLVASSPDVGQRPLVLEGSALYLHRLWRDETAVAADVAARASSRPPAVEAALAASVLERLLPDDGSGEQRRAAATAILQRLAVVAGGPGTGKTTTVARLLGALLELADLAGSRLPLVALAAPTGKAAARLAEAVQAEASSLEVAPAVRRALQGLDASTVHRLLGSRPGSGTRFRHDAENKLPHDVVVIDETSMLSLWLMAALTEAVRSDALLVLVGDPGQLASVEAGVVLADVVGPAGQVTTAGSEAAAARAAVSGVAEPAVPSAMAPTAIGDCVVCLRVNHRFSGDLADLAGAVRAGDADGALEVLRRGDGSLLEWVEADAGSDRAAQRLLAERAEAYARQLIEVARDRGAEPALGVVDGFRVLCAHRRGPAGAWTWNDTVTRLLAADPGLEAGSEWYVGRPVIVTANDYSLRLFNGDVGLVVAREDGGVTAVFRRGEDRVSVSPSMLESVAPVYAMTVHKAQGSEFDDVAIVLPDPTSRVLTRELLYTALTRARRHVLLVGTEEALRAGIERRIARASGLLRRLWGAEAVG